MTGKKKGVDDTMTSHLIIGTIGPASYQVKTLVSLIKKGMTGIRINLSHGELANYFHWIENIKQAREICGQQLPIWIDIQGPELRTGPLEQPLELKQGQELTLTPGDFRGTPERLALTYNSLPREINPGDRILINDGLLELRVTSIQGENIYCQVYRGGRLHSYQGINLPDTRLSLPCLTERDKSELKQAIELGIEVVMLPFTRAQQDVRQLRNFLDHHQGQQLSIMAKIENQQGIDNLSSILDIVEGAVIARGDLGVEIGLTRVPLAQRQIIDMCLQRNKTAVVVTHMLHSMISSPLPTRAEISDIAHAVFDGCQALMLTGETAIGNYPVTAMEFMARTVARAETRL
ncbi:MAG: pyruvate kinase [Bacillota bacterium]